MNVILDTNVFISGIFWSGTPAKILEAWHLRKFNLVLSTDILAEYVRVGNTLSKKFPAINIDDILEVLIRNSKIYDVDPLPSPVSCDKDDDIFIACALAADVKIIVSGDSDLLASMTLK